MRTPTVVEPHVTQIAVDVDNDRDLDVISATRFFASPTVLFVWHENIDGRGTFETRQSITALHASLEVADFDNDGDADLLLNGVDRTVWLENRLIGDSNHDGRFDSSDLVAVFQAGKYEDGDNNNATFQEGDWNQDGDFDSGDLVYAFQAGHYAGSTQPAATQAQIAAALNALYHVEENTPAKDPRHGQRFLYGIDGVLDARVAVVPRRDEVC